MKEQENKCYIIGTKLQANNDYPYGSTFYGETSTDHRFKYCGKELDKTQACLRPSLILFSFCPVCPVCLQNKFFCPVCLQKSSSVPSVFLSSLLFV